MVHFLIIKCLVLLTYGCLVRLLLKRGLREVRERPKKKYTEDKPG